MKHYKPEGVELLRCPTTNKHQTQAQDVYLYEGLPLQCIDTYGVFKNRQYGSVVSYDDDGVSIVVMDVIHQVPMKHFWAHWRVAYCTTLHSSQSITINEQLTIHEGPRMTQRMLYTAISRATRWEYVLFEVSNSGSSTSMTCVDEEDPEIKDYSQRTVGYIYHLVENDHVVYVGQTVNHERRFIQHKEKNYSNRNVYMVIVHEVRAFEDINELEKQEIDKFPADQLDNIRLNQCSISGHRTDTTVLVEAPAPVGCPMRGTFYYDPKETYAEFIWYMNGVRNKKRIKVSKTRAWTQVKSEIMEFAKTVYQ